MTRAARIAKAQRLRDEGLSHREIGSRLGVAHSTISKWLHPDKAREYNRRDSARPERKVAKRKWHRANRVPCPRCGKPTGHVLGQRVVQRCYECQQAEVAEFRQAVIDGYRAGIPAWQIAERIGRPAQSVANEAHRLRQQGIDIPRGVTGRPSHRSAA